MVPRPQEIFCGKLLYGRQIKIFAEFLFLVKTPCAPHSMWIKEIRYGWRIVGHEQQK
jgi:hypothetical protein